jgi:hypothetical protein
MEAAELAKQSIANYEKSTGQTLGDFYNAP